MMLRPCTREKELAEVLARGGWPDGCAPDLRAHAGACRSCGDLVLVTEAFQKARSGAIGAASVPSPGSLWWRAQLRRRTAAVERIGRPILGAQIFALTTCLLVAAVFLASQARRGIGWLTWLEQLPQAGVLHLDVLSPSTLFGSGWSLLLIPVLATLALLGGVAVYLGTATRE
jgi:hypothetical protein